jgi:hypothetical protein
MHRDHYWSIVRPSSEFLSFLIHPQEISSSDQQRHLVAKRETWQEMAVYLQKYLFHTPQGSLTCLKILWHGADGFTSPPKELVLRILSPLKISLPRPGLNPLTLGPMVVGDKAPGIHNSITSNWEVSFTPCSHWCQRKYLRYSWIIGCVNRRASLDVLVTRAHIPVLGIEARSYTP